MTYQELKALLRKHEESDPDTHLTAYITFSSFGPENTKEYPLEARTYIVSSSNKAFKPNKGGYSIFGSCLNGTDQYIRLENFMKEERGAQNGWVVEDCCIVGHMLMEHGEFNIFPPKLFFSHVDAAQHMLSRVAAVGEIDEALLSKSYHAANGCIEEPDWYSVLRDSAWVAGSNEDWRWRIQPVRIYGPLRMEFDDER